MVQNELRKVVGGSMMHFVMHHVTMPRIQTNLQETTERIVFNGIPYRRYPNSPKLELRNYFICSKGKDNRVRRLHQAIWEHHNGPIPKGYHIHHKDGNTLNNDIANLECLSNKDHRRTHWTPEESERARKHAESIRPLAKEWHASETGREWHKKHARDVWDGMPIKKHTCSVCRNEFESRSNRAIVRFCGLNCKMQSFRNRKKGTLQKTCTRCSTPFATSPIQPSEYCSHSCATKSAWETRKSGN